MKKIWKKTDEVIEIKFLIKAFYQVTMIRDR